MLAIPSYAVMLRPRLGSLDRVAGARRSVAILGGADGPMPQALRAAAVSEWRAARLRVAGVIAAAHNLPYVQRGIPAR